MELSAVEEEYLGAIDELEAEHSRPIRTVEIAEAVGVTSASVSNMIGRLDDRELLEYTPYRGVELTADGEAVAADLAERRRLLEGFLTDHLGLSPAVAREEADRLEHHVGDRLVRRLSACLEHSVPISTPEDVDSGGQNSPDSPLTDHGSGESLVVERITSVDDELREFLFGNGVRPGRALVVSEVTPAGVVTIEPCGPFDAVALATGVACRVRVRRRSTSN